jgi:NADP-dependent 3-hydroxy acid dehydrogenase YdfG
MEPRGHGAILFTGATAGVKEFAKSAPFAMGIADLVDQFGHSVLPLALDVTEAEQVRQVVPL